MIAKLRADYPIVTGWREWVRGGQIDKVELRAKVDIGCDDDTLPAFRMNVLDRTRLHAGCIRRWRRFRAKSSGLRRPGIDAAEEPFRGTRQSLRLGDDPDVPDIAVNRIKKGRRPVGKSPLDQSVRNCYDMAGNGIEWTSNFTDGKEQFLPRSSPDLYTKNLNLRGGSYYYHQVAISI